MKHMVSAALAFPAAAGWTADEPALPVESRLGNEQSSDGQRANSPHLPRPQRFTRSWPFQPTAVRLAAIHARTWLAAWRWAGDQDDALRVVTELVGNAVEHAADPPPGSAVELALFITEGEELLIDVSDPDPKFQGFETAVSANSSTGLGLVRVLAEDVTWGTPDIAKGKTVRVRMLPAAA
ncbi:ATP-binding protein [Streptomyces sp. Tu102]|uniref:ATP-binding protein n=1 Tax=Streptomyces TaxID=1883 RepID=UPI001BDBBC14|nr:ATP-binding protein [Streptomyces sp. Tu102]MBT1098101.1 ATP-binding protein [Streptomyces sp. Tu102]